MKGIKLFFLLVIGLMVGAQAALATSHTSYGNVTGTGVDTACRFRFYITSEPTRISTGNVLTLIGANYRWTLNAGDPPVNFATPVDVGKNSASVIWKLTGAGTAAHKGYFAVMNENLLGTTPQQYNNSTLREVPVATATATGSRVDVSWTAVALNPDTSENPDAGNVTGYNVYRSTDGINFTRVGSTVTNPGSGTVTFQDTTGTPGTTYYYAIELVFIGGIVAGDTTQPAPILASNSNSVTYPAAPPSFNFSMGVMPNNATVQQGNSATTTVTATLVSGTTTSVGLSATGQPAGVTITFAPTSGNPTFSSTMTVAVGAAVTPGDYPITINGTGGGLPPRSITYTLHVTREPVVPPTITGVNPTSAQQGETRNVDITGTNFVSGGGYTANFGTTDITVNSTTFINTTTLRANITLGDYANTIAHSVTVSGCSNSALFTITPGAPAINTVTWDTSTADNLKNAGYVYGTINLDGHRFGDTQGTSTVELRFPGGSYTTLPGAQIYSWGKDRVQVGVPKNIGSVYAVAGTVSVRVTVGTLNGENNFALKPKIYSVTPVSGEVGSTVTIEGTAFNPTAANNTIRFNTQDTTAASVTQRPSPSNDAIAVLVPTGATTGALTLTVNGQVSNANYDWGAMSPVTFTVTTHETVVTSETPIISGITPSNAYIGQTIVITGSRFGASQEGSTITIGGVPATPTAWSATSITVAVPNGVTNGAADVAITTAGGTGHGTLTIVGVGTGLVIDDFEGGCVGDWVRTPNSGYYVFNNSLDITPASSEIVANLRQTEAKRDGSLGARVRYSYVGTDGTDWGGGWGARLISEKDLSNYDKVTFYIRWDGSPNSFSFSLKDSDGTAYNATVSNSALTMLSNNFGKITLPKSSFTHDATADDAGDDDSFSWAHVANYGFVYTTKNTSNTFHYIDTIAAGDVNLGGTDEVIVVPTGEAPVIIEVSPSSAPAGTRFTMRGRNFGTQQNLSRLVFENNVTHTADYTVELLSWGDNTIEAVVPKTAPAGNYTLKVSKIASTAGMLQVFESNPSAFTVTAGMSAAGIATIYPNPFNPLSTSTAANQTTIAWNAGGATNMGLYIYDSAARLVYHRTQNTAQYVWNGYDDKGAMVADGVYLLRIINEESKTLLAKGKIMVVKK